MWLWVRDREGKLRKLVANPAQRAFERRRGRRNIVLKARQMGITTWVAGRYFLKTISQRGVLTVQVAHTRDAAESIFAVVHRMWENLPAFWREGPLVRSRANVGQMVFPKLDSEFRVVSAADENAGRGLTIQNLHLSEVSRWPGDAAAYPPPGLARGAGSGWRDDAWRARRTVLTARSTTSGSGPARPAWCNTSSRGGWSRRTLLPR